MLIEFSFGLIFLDDHLLPGGAVHPAEVRLEAHPGRCTSVEQGIGRPQRGQEAREEIATMQAGSGP